MKITDVLSQEDLDKLLKEGNNNIEIISGGVGLIFTLLSSTINIFSNIIT